MESRSISKFNKLIFNKSHLNVQYIHRKIFEVVDNFSNYFSSFFSKLDQYSIEIH